MSYALKIVGDAVSDLRELEPWLQEEVLDELESVTREPRNLRRDRYGEAVHDFDRRAGDKRHIVFIRLRRDDSARTITVLAIVACVRPWPDTE